MFEISLTGWVLMFLIIAVAIAIAILTSTSNVEMEYFESGSTLMVFNETIGQLSIFRSIKPK